MIYQLRDYTVIDGHMDDWVREWGDIVLPLRRKFGFEVVGAWVLHDEHRFVWIIGCEDDFEGRDRAYYTSDERKSLDPNPVRHLADTSTSLMRSVMPG